MNKKWSMRKYNEGKKPSEKVTTTRIKKYLADYPNTTGLAKGILLNWHLADWQLAIKFNKPEGVISRFRKLNERWMNGQRNFHKVKKPVQTFKSDGKTVVKKAILSCLLDKQSPKKGIVATLPFDFNFEKKLIKIPALSGLNFHGFEFAYHVAIGAESRKRFRSQKKTLRYNKKLAERVVMFNNNINDVLNKDFSNRYAHILADYCGTFTVNGQTIEHIIKNDLVQVGGIIWVTLSGHDKNGGGTKSKLPALVKKAGGTRYKVEKIDGEKVYQYQSGVGQSGSPMYVMVIRRVK